MFLLFSIRRYQVKHIDIQLPDLHTLQVPRFLESIVFQDSGTQLVSQLRNFRTSPDTEELLDCGILELDRLPKLTDITLVGLDVWILTKQTFCIKTKSASVKKIKIIKLCYFLLILNFRFAR